MPPRRIATQRNPSSGTACFIPIAGGGDDAMVPYCECVPYHRPHGEAELLEYVGYNLAFETVAHGGSDPAGLLVYATDPSFSLSLFDSTSFPGLPPDIAAHSGFAFLRAVTAGDTLMAMHTTISSYSTTNVTVVGHIDETGTWEASWTGQPECVVCYRRCTKCP
ncbi:hypothetical protein J3A83DRAFT_4196551 [Scleroderma citrinum]